MAMRLARGVPREIFSGSCPKAKARAGRTESVSIGFLMYPHQGDYYGTNLRVTTEVENVGTAEGLWRPEWATKAK